MSNNWMIVYVLEGGVYTPYQYGANIVPTKNVDKVIQVPEEIARQAPKFSFDGQKLKRKDGEYILTLEQLNEKEKQKEIVLWGGLPQHYVEEKEEGKIEVEF